MTKAEGALDRAALEYRQPLYPDGGYPMFVCFFPPAMPDDHIEAKLMEIGGQVEDMLVKARETEAAEALTTMEAKATALEKASQELGALQRAYEKGLVTAEQVGRAAAAVQGLASAFSLGYALAGGGG